MSGYQQRVAVWMAACFEPEVARDVRERCDRLLEEVLELAQSLGYDPSRVERLVQYVYGRPVGVPDQELGGVMVTLAALSSAAGLDMAHQGDRELIRITQPDVMERIREKQRGKRAIHESDPRPGAVSEGTSGRTPEREAQLQVENAWNQGEDIEYLPLDDPLAGWRDASKTLSLQGFMWGEYDYRVKGTS